jgi:hypothetical protein
MQYIEYVGTAASVIVAISLMMKNLKHLRLLNLAGSAVFAAYGAAIGSLPVLALNIFCVAADAYYLYKMRRERSSFALMRVEPGESEYLESFLGFYARDIGRFAPEFGQADLEGASAVFVLRDMVPANLVVYRKADDGAVELLLDYATPAYRDYRSADYFFEAAARDIASSGRTVFRARSSVAAHAAYLERMGFAPAKPGLAREGAAGYASDEWELVIEGDRPRARS